MKVAVRVLTVAILFVSPIAFGYADKNDTKDTGEVKWNLEYFEKTLPLKVKNSRFDTKSGNIVLLLEFSKEFPETRLLKEVFAPPTKGSESKLVFHLFDKDNITLGTVIIASIEGEISGKLGEAFRVTTFSAPVKALPLVRRIEARFAGKQTK